MNNVIFDYEKLGNLIVVSYKRWPRNGSPAMPVVNSFIYRITRF